MADILLIHAPLIINRRGEDWVKPGGDESSNYHMGLLYLAAYCEKFGVTSKILDISIQKITLESILDIVKSEQPKLIGISATSAGMKSAVHICQEMKKNYDIPVCLGGAHVNCDPHFIERVTAFDFCISGDGEKSLYDAFIKIKNGEKVDGIIHGKPIDNLDEIPFPARHLINVMDYVREEQQSKLGPELMPWATMLGSRGCPFKCTFCSIPLINHKVRYRDPKPIVDEMESIYDQCGGKYSFVDDVLTLNKKTTMDLCDEIISRGLSKKFRWLGMTRAEILNEELVARMAEAGCSDLFFGIESGNERIRSEVIDKKISNKVIRDAVQMCKKYEIHTSFLLMIGFPSETDLEMEETVNIGRKVGADIIGIHQTIPFPGTKIYDQAIEEGLIDSDSFDKFSRGQGWGEKDSFFDKWPKYVPDGLSQNDLISAKKRAYLKHYLRPSWAFGRIKHWIRAPHWFKHDIDLLKLAPYTLLNGKTKNSMS